MFETARTGSLSGDRSVTINAERDIQKKSCISDMLRDAYLMPAVQPSPTTGAPLCEEY